MFDSHRHSIHCNRLKSIEIDYNRRENASKEHPFDDVHHFNAISMSFVNSFEIACESCDLSLIRWTFFFHIWYHYYSFVGPNVAFSWHDWIPTAKKSSTASIPNERKTLYVVIAIGYCLPLQMIRSGWFCAGSSSCLRIIYGSIFANAIEMNRFFIGFFHVNAFLRVIRSQQTTKRCKQRRQYDTVFGLMHSKRFMVATVLHQMHRYLIACEMGMQFFIDFSRTQESH